jgi:hypothetical protein
MPLERIRPLPSGGMGHGGRVAAIALAAALAGSMGCAASAPRYDGERYLVAEHGFSIAAPPGEGASWRRVAVGGAVLAFRGIPGTEAEFASMSVLRRCEGAPTQPRLAARQLLIGLSERVILEDRAVEIAGGEGWLQTLEASDDDIRVRLRTVTRLEGGCSVDWVLISPPDQPGLDAAFDAWWSSWRAEPAGPEVS